MRFKLTIRQFLLIFIVLLLPGIACGTINPEYQLNNEVRQAVYVYERETRGPVKDLVIHFRRDEPRVRFVGQNQKGGHSVWLYPAGAEEYFSTRPQTATYLYIQEIQYNPHQRSATVKVYRGDGLGYQGWQLTVTREANGHWVVTDEVEIEGNPTQ
ncbi:MAG: hypothetical protein HS126_13980 [Anaerolineales bacterium]|nr:hypothetical protein [Anaerolineales bacterium]